MITLEGISKSYGSLQVLKNINMDIDSGRMICILGKSGCGKSTLLKLMALISRPTEGKILIDGKDTTLFNNEDLDKLRRMKISYSFQEPLLIPYLTTLENLTEVLGIPKNMAIEILTQLGLSERINYMPQKLSVGEKKRVDIARAFLKNSPLLIVDEPLSNLDPDNSLKVIDLFKIRIKKNGTVIYSSVEPSEVKFADYVINI